MTVNVITGDCLEALRAMPAESVHTCVTSPPYWGLRDYGVSGQVGLETTPDAFVARLVGIFAEVKRVLRDDGTIWVNLGDSYNSIGHKKSHSGFGTTGLAGGIAQEHTPLRRENTDPNLKHKDLCGIPWRVAFALQADGWYLRSDIIWSKPNPMPESVTDRPTKAHEYIFLLAKSERYYYDAPAIAEASAYPGDNRAQRADTRKPTEPKCVDGGSRLRTGNPTGETRNKRTVWTVTTKPYGGAHFATFPPDLIEPCILAGCPAGGTVLDPFGGAGTTGLVADRLQRNAVLIELNPEYADMARKRIVGDAPLFAEVQ